MNRRMFVAAVASGLAAAPLSAFAQPPAARMLKVGVLRPASDGPVFRQNFEPFHQPLRQSGFVEGTSVTIEYRVRAGTAEEISGLAAELARLRMDAIVAIGPAAVRAAADATKSTPIVAVGLAAPRSLLARADRVVE